MGIRPPINLLILNSVITLVIKNPNIYVNYVNKPTNVSVHLSVQGLKPQPFDAEVLFPPLDQMAHQTSV